MSIKGHKLHEIRAGEALPILVRQAHAQSEIFYSDLAKELGMPNPRNLDRVLGCIGHTLEDLSRSWKTDIPPIQCLVINKHTLLPGKGFGLFIANQGDFRKLSRKQQRLIVGAELQRVFSYTKWLDVLHEFNLQPKTFDYSKMLQKTRDYQGGGESEQHLRLKQFVASHPEILSLPLTSQAEIEYRLPSGDSLDVLFRSGKNWIGVEIKSEISDQLDIVRGLFQCVKYHAVIDALQAAHALPQNAKAVLVLGSALPSNLIGLKNILGIEVLENVRGING